MSFDDLAASITASNQAELSKLTDLIHDMYVNLDALEWEKQERTLTLPIHLSKGRFVHRADTAHASAYIEIRNVERYEVIDPERIGFYGLNTFELKTTEGLLQVHLDPRARVDVWTENLLVVADSAD